MKIFIFLKASKMNMKIAMLAFLASLLLTGCEKAPHEVKRDRLNNLSTELADETLRYSRALNNFDYKSEVHANDAEMQRAIHQEIVNEIYKKYDMQPPVASPPK